MSGCSWLIILIGTNTAGAIPLIIPLYTAGVTPTMVYCRPESRTVCPTTFGSPPYARSPIVV